MSITVTPTVRFFTVYKANFPVCYSIYPCEIESKLPEGNSVLLFPVY